MNIIYIHVLYNKKKTHLLKLTLFYGLSNLTKSFKVQKNVIFRFILYN